MFTKQHYKAIAEVLRVNQPRPAKYQPLNERKEQQIRYNHHQYIVDRLANLFAQDNSRFDWDKFITAATQSE